MNLRRVNHIGIVVQDLAQATDGFARLLGLRISHTEKIGSDYELIFLPCGDSQVELIHPRVGGNSTADYLKKHGPGIQHVAFEVDDIDAALEELRGLGVHPLGEAPLMGAANHLIAFLDPEAFGGILVELCQPVPEGGR